MSHLFFECLASTYLSTYYREPGLVSKIRFTPVCLLHISPSWCACVMEWTNPLGWIRYIEFGHTGLHNIINLTNQGVSFCSVTSSRKPQSSSVTFCSGNSFIINALKKPTPATAVITSQSTFRESAKAARTSPFKGSERDPS